MAIKNGYQEWLSRMAIKSMLRQQTKMENNMS